jgi:DNA-binding transcriptional MerR regulator
MSEFRHLPVVAKSAAASHVGEADVVVAADLLRVGDVARACGKTVRAIHHYEKIGLLEPEKRSTGGYRLYAEDAVTRVKWIGKLHDLGMTLSEIKQILSAWKDAASAPAAMATLEDVYRQKLDEVRMQIAHLSTLEHELEASLNYLQTCTICDPKELIAACSSCTVHTTSEPQPDLVSGLYAGDQSASNDN